jgi:microcystin-dependent protein
MSNPYIGEIRMFGGSFAPAGWMFCDGSLLPISENDALFTLIGTTYGGDGQETFALPNILGETGGVEEVTLTVNQIPSHNHPMLATSNVSNAPVATGNLIGQSTKVDTFIDVNPTNAMNPGSIGPAGGSQPHENLMPYLCISFIISLFGVYPTQS